MPSLAKYTSEQWAEARRLRAEGLTFKAIAAQLGFKASKSISDRARKEGWVAPEASPPTPARRRSPVPRKPSPATIDIRMRLSQRLYRIIEIRIRKLELNMQKRLQALEQDPNAVALPAMTQDERDAFASLIESINQVTEMASEPASAADGRRKSANINPELSALSDDIDPDALAAASEKDQLRREIADKLDKLVSPA